MIEFDIKNRRYKTLLNFFFYFIAVNFIKCLSRGPMQRSCSTTEFKCNNSNCIDKEKICNFHNDCKENSDESETGRTKCGMVDSIFAIIMHTIVGISIK